MVPIIDSGALTAGVAVVGLNNTVNGTNIGNWEVSSNNGSSWTALTGISATTARLLEPGSGATTNLLRFVPSGAVGGTVSLDLRLWDRTSDTVGTYVNPGSGGGSSAYSTNSRTITFTSSAITLAGTASSLSLTEGQTLAPGSGITLSSGNLSSARVLIASGLTSGDQLLYIAPSGNPITGSYDVSKGELLLSGNANSSQYQEALRAVTFKVGDDPTQFSSKRDWLEHHRCQQRWWLCLQWMCWPQSHQRHHRHDHAGSRCAGAEWSAECGTHLHRGGSGSGARTRAELDRR